MQMVTRSVSKVELSWEDVASGNFPLTPQQLFAQAVLAEAAKAKAAMPHANGRVERARDLVLAGLVQRQPDYSFAIASGNTKGKTYVVDRDGHCDCPDALKIEGGRCKHLLATWIWRRARAAVETQDTNGTVPAPDGSNAPAERTASDAPDAPGIPAWALVELHGKQFVTFGGLLAMAHERGLQGLAAHFVSVTAELALAEATATFADGKTFTEAADATPKNVNRQVAPHFPRCAITRAKARALRDALNISMAAIEELEQ
jgi:hypothetical protein